jgi:cytochrome c peroxidase
MPSFLRRRYWLLSCATFLGVAPVPGWIVSAASAAAVGDTQQQILLGKQLFNDKHLSKDGTTSCASCHNPAMAFADGRPVAVGIANHAGSRNTPSLLTLNASNETSFFWDGRRTSLKDAVLDPLTNPVEMGLNDREQLKEKLATVAGSHGALTPDDVAAALTAYLHSIKQPASAYDLYRSTHDTHALTPRALEGLALFAGKARCAECHSLEGSPVQLTDHGFHRTSVVIQSVEEQLPLLTTEVINESLSGGPLGNKIATHPEEAQLGRFNVTHDVADIEKFRTPSLRSVSLTAPYMHDGSVKTLDEALDREVYYRSLHTGRPLNLSVEERKNLLAFLQAL